MTFDDATSTFGFVARGFLTRLVTQMYFPATRGTPMPEADTITETMDATSDRMLPLWE